MIYKLKANNSKARENFTVKYFFNKRLNVFMPRIEKIKATKKNIQTTSRQAVASHSVRTASSFLNTLQKLFSFLFLFVSYNTIAFTKFTISSLFGH